jgi:hypothetical protein
MSKDEDEERKEEGGRGAGFAGQVLSLTQNPNKLPCTMKLVRCKFKVIAIMYLIDCFFLTLVIISSTGMKNDVRHC